jgi:hypothetical protein
VGIAVVYAGQWDTGLYYDDYHMVRPLLPLELRRVWFGSWDVTGIERPFFRPLTTYLFSLRFWLFGLNITALHAMSLIGHALAGVLSAWFLRREGLPLSGAVFGAWLYAIHPLFPYAQVSWLTNQMHLADSLLVLIGLLVWQTVRERALVWWGLLLPIAAAAFFVKEDALLLLPVIIALTFTRGWMIGSPQWKRWMVLVAIASLAVGALASFRHSRLGQLGGYGLPNADQAQLNFWKGLDSALLLWPTRTPWQGVASVPAIAAVATAIFLARRRMSRPLIVAACLVIGMLAIKLPALFYEIQYPLITWQGIASGIVVSATAIGLGIAVARQDRRALFIISAGLVIAFGFDVPFALVSKREQYHLLALGAVLLLAGVAHAFEPLMVRHPRPAVIGAVVVTLPLALLGRSQAADFAPCSAAVTAMDDAAASWWVVSVEIKTWVREKSERCRNGESLSPLSDLPVVSWGVHDDQTVDSIEYRWTSEHAVLALSRAARSIALAFRRPDASSTNVVSVRISGGTTTANLLLESPEWQYVTVPFSPGVLSALRDGHRLDIDVSPWFVPAVLDPRNSDLRRFGVHLRVIGVYSR